MEKHISFSQVPQETTRSLEMSFHSNLPLLLSAARGTCQLHGEVIRERKSGFLESFLH